MCTSTDQVHHREDSDSSLLITDSFPQPNAYGHQWQTQDDSEKILGVVLKLNQCGIKRIIIYQGDEDRKPIYYEEVHLFKKLLSTLGVNWEVKEVSDSDFFPEQWDPTTSILMIPGAKSSELDDHIGHKVQEIQEFIHKGGHFLGWCGGAYWACHRVSYQLSPTTKLKKERHLDFWKGKEKGPLLPYKGLESGTIEYFHGTVNIKWKGVDATLPVLLSGGGSFIPSENEHTYEVLATYQGVSGELSRAAVKTYPGKGIAILANPYFTYNAEYFKRGLKVYEENFPQHNWRKIIFDLEGNESLHQLCFAMMLNEFTQREK